MTSNKTKRGTLFLVVGPSGAGKDTLLDGAKEALADNPNWVFPARYIDRPADAGGEAHKSLSSEEFQNKQKQGGFALSWAAHNLHYGISADIHDDLSQGRNVVINVSRQVIASARENFRPLSILVVTAPAPLLAERLAARGRESTEDIKARLTRAFQDMPSGDDVITVINDGPIDQGVARFLEALNAPRH